MTPLEMAWYLLCSHAVFDGALQTSYLGTKKAPIVDGVYNPHWFAVLSCHSIICGAGVSLVTGIWWLGVAESIWHFCTDWLSTRKHISFFLDQVSHLVAKVVWLGVWYVVHHTA